MADKSATAIDTGDHVRHGPTGEEWVVAYVKGDRLAWCGWPEGEALLSDCELIRKATPAERLKLLHEMARLPGDCPRKTHAWAQLEPEVQSANTGHADATSALRERIAFLEGEVRRLNMALAGRRNAAKKSAKAGG